VTLLNGTSKAEAMISRPASGGVEAGKWSGESRVVQVRPPFMGDAVAGPDPEVRARGAAEALGRPPSMHSRRPAGRS